jgi:hypothetical protein
MIVTPQHSEKRRHTMVSFQEESLVMGRISMDTMTGLDEDPYVMGRTLLVFIVVELMIGLGVYKLFL